MRRREFISLLGSATATLPLAARAQQAERMRRIGVLIVRGTDDPLGQTRVAAFQHALQQLGWSDARNVRIDIRWHENDADRARRYAQELVALALTLAARHKLPAVYPIRELVTAGGLVSYGPDISDSFRRAAG